MLHHIWFTTIIHGQVGLADDTPSTMAAVNLQNMQVVHCSFESEHLQMIHCSIQSEQDALKQSRGSSLEDGTTEVVEIRPPYSRCACRVTGCSWSCGRFCWKIPDGWARRAQFNPARSPPHLPRTTHDPLYHPPPPPAALPLALALDTACHPCCALSIFKSDECGSVLLLDVGMLLVTVGLVHCP